MNDRTLSLSQMWQRELSLILPENVTAPEYEAALQAVASRNPLLAADPKALHFTVQGWIAAKRDAAV